MVNIKEQRPEEVLELLESILTSTDDLVTLSDEKGEIAYMNRVVPGLSERAVMGTHLYDYVPKESRETVKGMLGKCLKTGERITYEIEGTGSNGSMATYLCRLSPCAIGGKRMVLCVATDITEQKALEKQLRDQIKNLETINSSMIDREERMIELKHELEELKKSSRR